MDELSFKLKIANYFNETPDKIINFEYPFDYNKRRCDVLIVENDSVTAIEIKSNIDKLTNLKEQLFSYYQAFNTVYVACGDKHINEIKRIKGRFGIIYINNNEIKIVRKAKLKKTLNTRMILDMLDKTSLEKVIGIKMPTKQELIELILITYSQTEIQKIYYKTLKNKLSPIHKIFLKEKGKHITQEDIALLTLKSTRLSIN
ncbi:sce7726 family protein [Escherichia coli]|uniref:sce7726 family protein n=8 Tax=Escherichia coli TaxID=562 RepID=UPI000BB98FF5|nr:sce7726 family protein [Escherichia coli]EFD5109224.1 sce7726 family protein [Escherichia coli]EIA1803851.1 sce7726 family protein [Escherichia coli]PBU36805.1 hypothetical protein BB547_23295 [Escherichia coli]PBU44544.1 hypothetical protein BB545_11110 [Escherichia coli]PBU82153.1 hypothetical protein BB549_00480 [Escherichia coli]